MGTKQPLSKSNFPPLLHLSYILQQSSDERLLEELGVGLSQARIMSVLHRNAARSQRSVASELAQTEANVSRQLRHMHKQGLVSIKHSKSDARQREVVLTAKGFNVYQKAEKLLKKQQSQFLRLLAQNELKVFEKATQNLSKSLN
ncbi:MAG TPA: MarR family winged helix-turn-helix transcriptional regulator [Candidatus Saccharimonadales bacterium]|nr:MarR family winged helix-turn-helix transcriptional regulator [Candidatus Saccharimonadales bacterium]